MFAENQPGACLVNVTTQVSLTERLRLQPGKRADRPQRSRSRRFIRDDTEHSNSVESAYKLHGSMPGALQH